MTILEWLIIGGIAATILSIIFFLYSILQVIVQSRKLKKIAGKQPKSPKKRKRWQRVLEKLKAKRMKSVKLMVLFLVLGGSFAGATVYGNFYQATNLLADDEDAIVRSYFLLRDFQDELSKAAGQEESQEATSQNIRYLSTNLAAFSARRASTLNTVEGQRTLNRYYNALTELGVNAAREVNNLYGNEDLVADFQADVERTIGYETAAFEYYKVNEASFQNEGASDGE